MNRMYGRPEPVDEMIRHAIEAGRLRTFVRENGPGLQGLERLAERYSQMAAVLATHVAKAGGNLL